MKEFHDSRPSRSRQGPSRRALLAGAGVTCAAMLAGCTTDDASGTATSAPGNAATALAATSQVPDGGGTIIDAKRIVITQPQSGSFKAFSAICTHEGCFVASVSNGTINCPCHGSKFSIKDGSVVHGPATRSLPPIAINVEGTSIFEANLLAPEKVGGLSPGGGAAVFRAPAGWDQLARVLILTRL